MSEVNKYGLCPSCNKSWEGKDIQDELNNLSVFKYKSQKNVEAIAGNFGYSEENKTKFSKVIVIESGNDIFYKCPEIRCGKVFNSKTGDKFNSIEQAKRGIAEIQTEDMTPEKDIIDEHTDINMDDLPF